MGQLVYIDRHLVIASKHGQAEKAGIDDVLVWGRTPTGTGLLIDLFHGPWMFGLAPHCQLAAITGCTTEA
ncbi:hypothetical protein GCM10009091_31360 [Pseudomonas brenneri]|nr:hypothetical protein GCM10009091_31360 [Pseudomonas brenneri]